VSAQDQELVRVLVVDDSEVFRNVLCAVVAAAPGFQVVGVAATGREALDLVGVLDAQFVLIDVNTRELDGVETALRIRSRHPGVVVLLLTATRRASVRDASIAVEDKRDLSPRWLVDFWRQNANGTRTH
jgi:chemotaxis response regulator CheB